MTKKILITSALPYIDWPKHLGNLVGSMLPADVYARFNRMIGNTVCFICATDEHGTPAELAATAAGMGVAEYCRVKHRMQSECYRKFMLSFDHFGRSSSENNIQLTQYLHGRLDENDFIEKRTTRQVYSVTDRRFLPDRYIIGDCPFCGYSAARGDQCENCTRLLNPTKLINPASSISGTRTLEVRESTHLFLKQSDLMPRIREWIDNNRKWPNLVRSIANSWLNEGLEDRCITRDLKWGVPVNRRGFEDKVFYVWFDAPIAYIAETKSWSDQDPAHRDWRSWWYDASDVTYVQFMAKDNIPFHTVSFPCTLLGSGEPWKLPDYIKGFNWLTYNGGKFSTSQKRGVFLDRAIELFPADYWRYWLMFNAPESQDADFTFRSFAGTINKDLADILGNFINRTFTFALKHFGSEIPRGGEFSCIERELAKDLDRMVCRYRDYLERMKFRKAISELRSIWMSGNGYLARTEPWLVIKKDRKRTAAIIRTAINLSYLFATLSYPVIPAICDRVIKAVNLRTEPVHWPQGGVLGALRCLNPGHPITIPLPIKKISAVEVNKLESEFDGSDSRRASVN